MKLFWLLRFVLRGNYPVLSEDSFMMGFMHVCGGRGMLHDRLGLLQGRNEERKTMALELGAEQNRDISVAIQRSTVTINRICKRSVFT